jgi:acetyl esterase/lipase
MLAAVSRRISQLLLCVTLTGGPLLAETPKSSATGPFMVSQTLDIRYHPGEERQLLDVFSPKGASSCPVVVFAHGGAWIIGDKNMFGLYRSVGKFLARNGVVAVLVNYRLSPAVQHPEHTRDLARAYAWTRRHIKNHGGDPDHLFLAGHSAGGHLVALLATDDAFWKDPGLGLNKADRAALRGVIAVCGVYRIPGPTETTAMIAELLNGIRKPGQEAPTQPPGKPDGGTDFKLFQMVFGDGAQGRADASPLNHVRKGLPPFLLLWAQRELPMLPQMAKEFGKALKAAGNAVEECRIPNCHHNTILFKLTEKDDPTAKALLDFIDRHAARPMPAKAD